MNRHKSLQVVINLGLGVLFLVACSTSSLPTATLTAILPTATPIPPTATLTSILPTTTPIPPTATLQSSLVPPTAATEEYFWQFPSISFPDGGGWGAIIQSSEEGIVVSGWKTDSSGHTVFSGFADKFIDVDINPFSSFTVDNTLWYFSINPYFLPHLAVATMGGFPIAFVSQDPKRVQSCFTETGLMCVVFKDMLFFKSEGKADVGNLIIGIQQNSWSSNPSMFYMELRTSTVHWIGQIDLKFLK